MVDSLAQKYELADSILGNLIGITYRELRSAKRRPIPDAVEIEQLNRRFNDCHERREKLRLAGEAELQAVIDSISGELRAALASAHG